MRGPLAPPRVPLARTRAERFEDHVRDAVELLERRWADELARVEFAVEEVPPVSAAGSATDFTSGSIMDESDGLSGILAGAAGEAPDSGDGVPLGRLVRGSRGRSGARRLPDRIVVYRMPLEARAASAGELAVLVYGVIVRELATLLDLDPETVDPTSGESG